MIMATLYTVPFFVTWFIPAVFFLMTNIPWTYGLVNWFTPLNQLFMVVYIGTALPLQGYMTPTPKIRNLLESQCQKRLQRHAYNNTRLGWVRLITMIVTTTTKKTNTTEGQYITNHESRNTTNGFNRFNTGCSSGADYDTKRCNEDEEEKTEAVNENTE